MPTARDKAKDNAAGGFDVPPVATPPGSGIQTGDVSETIVVDQQIKDLEQKLGMNAPDTDQHYVDHRAVVHSVDAQINALEDKLGMNAPPESPPLPKKEEHGIWDTVVRGLKDMPAQIPAGSLNAFNELGNGLLDVASWAEKHTTGTSMVPSERAHGFGQMVFGEPDTMAGRITSGVSQFLTGFLPANRLMNGVKVLQAANGTLKIVKGLAAGGLADFAVFDPHQERLSNLVQEHPSLANPVTAYLAANPKDTEAEGRFKNALEGMGLGAVVEGLVGSVKYLRGAKRLNEEGLPRGGGGAPGAGTGEPVQSRPAPVAAEGVTPGAAGGEAPAEAGVTAGESSNIAPKVNTAQDEARIVAQAEREAIAAMTPEERTAYFKQFKNPAEARAKYDESVAAAAEPQAAAPAAAGADGEIPQAIEDAAKGSASTATGKTIPPEAARPAGEKIAPTLIERFEGPGDLVGTQVPKTAAEKEAAGQSVLQNAGGLESDKAVNINLNKIDGSTDLKTLLRTVGETFGADMQNARRGVVSDEMVAKLATDLGMTSEDLAKRLRGQALNAEEITASRVLLNASAEDLMLKARAAAAPGAGDVEKAAFLNALEAHKAIQLQVTGATAEAGRALRALRQVVGVPGEAERAKMLKQMVSLFETGPEGTNVAQLAQSISEMGNVADISKFTQKSLTRRLFDAAMEVRVNNLLSGARTFTTNLVSNTYMMFGKVGETYLAQGLGAFKKGSAMNADRVVNGEAQALLSGIIDGMWDGFRIVKQSIADRTPIDGLTQVPVSKVPALSAQSFNLSGPLGQAVDYLGIMTRLPGHGLNMTDAFFKAVNYRMEIRRQAVREAAYRGLEGAEQESFIKQFLANPPDEFKFRAQEEARVNTFTNLRPDTGLLSEQTIRAVQGTAAGRIALPFLRTNFNMIDYVIQRSPILNRLSPQMVDDIAAGGARADLARAKIAFGYTVMLTTGALAARGLVTGAGPVDKDAKKALESTGWRPYSVLVGNKYYSYNRVEPLGTILGMSADWAEIAGHVKSDSNDVGDMAFAAAVTAAHIGPAQNLVESMVEMGELFDKPEVVAKKWISQNLASSIVPNAIRQFGREGGDAKFNTSAREFKLGSGRARYVPDDSIFQETINKIKASIPGYGEGLPAQHNLFGEVVTYDPGWGPDIASPIYVSEVKDSPIRKEMARLSLQGYKFDMPPDHLPSRMGAIPLNAAQHEKYIELSAGVGLKAPGVRKLEDELNYQVKNNFPAYGVNPKFKVLDAQRFAMIDDIIRKYRELAGKQLGSGMDPVGQDLAKKYTELGNVKYESLTGNKQPVTITAPGGGKVK